MAFLRCVLALAILAVPAFGGAAAPSSTVFLVVSQDTWRGLRGGDATLRTDRAGTPVVLIETDAHGIAELGRYVHEREHRCGGFFSFPTRAEAEAFIATTPANRTGSGPRGGYTIDNQATVAPWLTLVSEPAIVTTIATLQTFHNRHFASPTGVQAATWIRDRWLALASERSDVHVELFTACSECALQPSVILTIDGTTMPEEIVVLGAHLDSINWVENGASTARAPGADDDGSGVAALTEILRIALAGGYRPQRTVQFMAYAAEEVGLRGSHAIASAYQANGKEIVGMLQLDMTNYHEPGQADIEIIQDFTDPALSGFLADLFDAYLAPLGLTRGASNCGYGCSDHASWQTAGYPSAFAFEGGGLAHMFGLLHTANDLLENMGGNAGRSVPFVQLGLAFLGELAKGSEAIFADGFEAAPSRPPIAE